MSARVVAADALGNVAEPERVQAPRQEPRPFTGGLTPFAEKALSEEVSRVASAVKDTRHKTIYSAARNLGELSAGGELPRGLVESSLFDAAAELVAERGERYVERVIRDGIDKGILRPRHGEPTRKASPRPAADVPEEPAGFYDDDQQAALAMLATPRPQRRKAWTPSTLEGVTDPNVGRVEYQVERQIPRGEVVGYCATFKSGKTLMIYSLALSALRAGRVFGMFNVLRPLRVVVFQEEMPSREDERRLRRLAIGLGMDPAEILGFVASGRLVFYNRVGLDLSTPEGVARFHAAVRDADADLVILDSLIAAAGAVDLNDNGQVRRMFTAAFLPLTTEGRSIVFLHHKRKGGSAGRGKDTDRDSFLGAQAIAAASGRMYSLERLDDPEDAPKDPTRFRCALTLFGSWTPEEAVSTILETRDDGDGTTVTALDVAAQVKSGGIDTRQRAALALVKLVNSRRSVSRAAALDDVAIDLEISTRTAASGLAFARKRGWIDVVRPEGGKTRAVKLVPGPKLEDAS